MAAAGNPNDEHLAYDDALLDAAADRVAEMHDVPRPERLERLRRIVPQIVAARRPDGSWPPPDLLREVLRSYLDVLDRAGRPGDDNPRWVAALRECTDHPATFERMLDELRTELRAEESTVGIPSQGPPADLPYVVEP